MGSRRRVQNTHNTEEFRALHMALIEIIGVFNRPDRDAEMVRRAGVPLDRALFPLLVLIERVGPIGVGELADWVGRDYTTVSRQVAKLESQGLVKRQDAAADRRIREAVITAKGKALTDRIDATRERMARLLFADWSREDFGALLRLTRRFADGLKALTEAAR